MSKTKRDTSIRIPRSAARAAMAVGAIVLFLIVIAVLGAVARAAAPTTAAAPAELKVQQSAAERDVERAYEQAATQVRRVRALNLAISAAQADQIANKALADLKTLRHSAFTSLGQIEGLAASDAEQYAVATEGRFDGAPVLAGPTPTPVLLAPRYYAIVTRMSEVATQLSDLATTQLTASPSSSPVPTSSTRPSASPSPSR